MKKCTDSSSSYPAVDGRCFLPLKPPPHHCPAGLSLTLFQQQKSYLRQLSTIRYHNRHRRLPDLAPNRLNLLQHIKPVRHPPEHHMLPVQPGRLQGTQEKLRAISIRTSVRHRQNTRPIVGELEALIFKLVAVDALPPSPIAAGKVATLAHEPRNDPMEGASFITEALLTRAERAEVLRGFGDGVAVQAKDDAARGLVGERKGKTKS